MDPPSFQRSNSVQMRAHMPEERTRKKQQKLAQIKNNQQLCTKVPIWLQISYRNEEKFFVIDPNQKVGSFKAAIEAYLKYYKQHSDKGYYYVLKNQHTKFVLSELHAEMGSLYDRYKTEQGWLEIEIKEDSMF